MGKEKMNSYVSYISLLSTLHYLLLITTSCRYFLSHSQYLHLQLESTALTLGENLPYAALDRTTG